jgi:dUTP pyrophosphatase
MKIALLNFGAQPVHIRAGDRLAQGVFLPAPRVVWDEVTTLRSESRGGFGGSGE